MIFAFFIIILKKIFCKVFSFLLKSLEKSGVKIKYILTEEVWPHGLSITTPLYCISICGVAKKILRHERSPLGRQHISRKFRENNIMKNFRVCQSILHFVVLTHVMSLNKLPYQPHNQLKCQCRYIRKVQLQTSPFKWSNGFVTGWLVLKWTIQLHFNLFNCFYLYHRTSVGFLKLFWLY